MITLDPQQLEMIANAASFAATYLKYREDRNESVDAEDFKRWLQSEIFPQLLNQSEKTLNAVISVKAYQRDQYDTLLEHLLAKSI